MKKILLSLFVLSFYHAALSQKIPKGAVLPEALSDLKNITVSFEQERNTFYNIMIFRGLMIETDYNQFTSLSDSAGNKIVFRTPTQAINFFEDRGWELRFINTTPLAYRKSGTLDDEITSRLSLFFRRKKNE